MATIPSPRFTFKNPNAERSLVYLIYRYRGLKFRYSTQITIDTGDWNPKTQRPYELERRPDLWAIRRTLDDVAVAAKDIYIRNQYSALSKKEFKAQLDLRLGRVAPPTHKATLPLIDFMDQELAEMKRTGMRHSSYRVFSVHAQILKDFAKSQGGFSYEDVDWTLRLALIDWLSDKGVQLAYGNKTLNVLRQFMERARRKGHHSCTGYLGKGWQVRALKARSDTIVLSLEELDTLANMTLSGHLKKVRDLLLIGVGTGQRFSDFSRLTPQNFYTTAKGVPLLSVIAQKTGMPAKIPLNFFPWLVPTLEKYAYTAPRISMQKFNQGLKSLCKHAQIDQEVRVVEQYIGRKPRLQKRFTPKYDVVSSHICRRSFATNLYRMGYSLAQIMPMTGHATETQLRIYIGINAEENAENIALQIAGREDDAIRL